MPLRCEGLLAFWNAPKTYHYCPSGSPLTKISVMPFAKLPISAPISDTVFNCLLSKRCNVYLALALTLLHKFHSAFPGNVPAMPNPLSIIMTTPTRTLQFDMVIKLSNCHY
jgi:hypothetical protein